MIKITIDIDSNDEAYFDAVMRRVSNVVSGNGPKSHVNGKFSKTATEIPEVPVGRWPKLRNIIVQTRSEAEEVLDRLNHILSGRGSVSVADLMDTVGLPAGYPDTKYGWTTLVSAQIRRHREGYLIWLQTPEPL